MSSQLIYKRAVPVSSRRHGQLCLEPSGGYGFAREINTVPILVAEFDLVARECPILFIRSGERSLPVALLGVLPKQNVFVDEEGKWKGQYVPAFLRRYPFVFGKTEKPDKFLLCIDESYPGLNSSGRGARLFEADGKPSRLLDGAATFLKQFGRFARDTEDFCGLLDTLDILVPAQARITGTRSVLRGGLAVDEKKMKALSAEKLKELVGNGSLRSIYSHLDSIARHQRSRAAAAPARPVDGVSGREDPTDRMLSDLISEIRRPEGLFGGMGARSSGPGKQH